MYIHTTCTKYNREDSINAAIAGRPPPPLMWVLASMCDQISDYILHNRNSDNKFVYVLISSVKVFPGRKNVFLCFEIKKKFYKICL